MRLLWVAAAAAILAVPPVAVAEQDSPRDIVHGTINIAIGNQEGIVVLTDSMLTSGDGQQLPQPSQKLFKLDDRTVCAIAGFASAPAVSGPGESHPVSVPDLNTSASAIIREYVRQSVARDPQSVAEKLWALSSLMGMHLSVIANLRETLHNPTPLRGYLFQLIVAGYDLDGTPKIAKITLEMKPWGAGLRAEREAASVEKVENKIVWKLGGMPDVASDILTRPEVYAMDDPAFDRYATAMTLDQGRSISTAQMRELATRLAYYTAEAHREVGGPNQIAILRKGHVIIEQAAFPEPPKPIVNFNLLVDSKFAYSGVSVAEGVSMVLIRCSWEGMQWRLDGNYFIESNFRNSTLFYDGGNFGLGETNHVTDSVLVLGPRALLIETNVIRLINSFPWSRLVYTIQK